MKHLYILAAASLFSAASASAQTTKHPSGASPELVQLKSTQRAITWANGQRGGGPANDECAGAIPVTVGADCVSVNATLAGATESQPASQCSGFTSSVANDVWFSFVATSTTTAISVTGGAGTTDPDTTGIDPVFELFTGDCGSLTAVGCVDATLPAGTTETAQATTVVGTTYYYRVYYWAYGGAPTNYEFTTCVFAVTLPDPPANDDCAGAIAVTPLAFCGPLNYTGVGATQSQPGVVCGGTVAGNANDDIWFSFVATQTTMTIGAIGAAGSGADNTVYDAVVEAYASCGGASIGCADATLSAEPESLELTGLTIGATYVFRVFHWYTAPADPFVVGVCVVEGGGISIGMPELNEAQEWMVFPNPSSNIVNLKYAGASGTGSIEFHDVAGRLALVERRWFNSGATQQLNIESLAPGVYTIQVSVNGEQRARRLIVE
jgi:hypothetical protein